MKLEILSVFNSPETNNSISFNLKPPFLLLDPRGKRNPTDRKVLKTEELSFIHLQDSQKRKLQRILIFKCDTIIWYYDDKKYQKLSII